MSIYAMGLIVERRGDIMPYIEMFIQSVSGPWSRRVGR